MFDKTQKFVKDTQYLYTIIQSKEFYDRNGCFYQQTMTRYDSYCNVSEDELVKEVNSSPLQICFDDYKKLLNCVNIPNMDIASMSWFIHRKLSSDRELIEDAIGIYETVIETCGNLRNSVADFMELYGLVDNFPKTGFLCPMFIDEAMSKESNEHAPISSILNNENDDPKTWDEHEFDGIEPYRIDFTGKKFSKTIFKIHEFLINRRVIHKEVGLNYFTACIRKARYERLYKTTKSSHKLIYVSKQIAQYAHDVDKYRRDIASSMGYDNIKKWEKICTDDKKFRKDLEDII